MSQVWICGPAFTYIQKSQVVYAQIFPLLNPLTPCEKFNTTSSAKWTADIANDENTNENNNNNNRTKDNNQTDDHESITVVFPLRPSAQKANHMEQQRTA